MGKTILLTLAPSHFSEKARWALQRAKLDFVEQRHAPLFHRLANRLAGGGNTCPVLVTDERVYSDSSDILAYADRLLSAEQRLYPADSEQHGKVCQLEQQFGKQVGFSVIRFGYFHILPQSQLGYQLLSLGVPKWEATCLKVLFPLIRFGMTKGLNLTATNAARCLERIQAQMDLAADMLSDGRPYLLGDTFTAADLTLAALLAPLFCVPNYGGASVQEHQLPPSLGEQYLQWKSHRVYEWVHQIYRQHR